MPVIGEHQAGADGVPVVATRPGPRLPETVWGWLGPIAVALVGGVLRFTRLDAPPTLVFDETYYVKQAWSLLRYGTIRGWGPDADQLWNAGRTDIFDGTTQFAVHPPGGTWTIALGEWLFGAGPLGWRCSAALAGTLSVLLVARIGRRLLGSTLLGCAAGLLLAVDGVHLVLSRTGLLDVLLSFWVLAGFGCLVADRGRARAGEARVRWWRLAAGVCLGLACGVKWSGLPYLLVFALLAVGWDIGARRAAGTLRRWSPLLDAAATAATMLPAALAAYLACWSGWLLRADGWGRQDGGGPLGSLWAYHVEMYRFHTALAVPHPYQAAPDGWLLLARPTAFFYQRTDGCGSACVRAIVPIGNPVLWWGGCLALLVLLFAWALGRDWRAGAVLAGVAAGWLPWFFVGDRTTFAYYAVVFSPFLALGVAHGLGLLLGPPDAGPQRRRTGALLAGAVLLAALLCAAWFHPVLTGALISRPAWADRMWLPSWI